MRRAWLKHGFWNTLEHAVTRFSDAGVTVLLLWGLPTEVFSKLALAQAWVAPLLLFFVAPETVMYRDFGKWKAMGAGELSARLRAFRLFGWAKAQFALALSLIWTAFAGDWQWFSALIWAFSLALAPQISGADREFLRLDLKLTALNAISFYQKLTLIGGAAAAVLLAPQRLEWLAAVGVFSAVSSALLARAFSGKLLREMPVETAQARASSVAHRPIPILGEALGSFSIWNHLWGVIFNWVQTLDILVLGAVGLPARELGLYAAVVKLANFSLAVPTALTNLFGVWIGRRAADADRPESRARESYEVKRLSGWLFVGSFAQAGVLILLGPWLLALFSRGRWTPEEQSQMLGWFAWILAGVVFVSSSFILSTWLVLRSAAKQVVFRVALPWVIFSIVLYAATAYLGGTRWVAIAHVAVGAAYALLLMMSARRRRET